MSFPRYPSYKDSQAEWITCLPSHWNVTRLKRRVTSTNAGEVIDKSYWGGEEELLYTCAIEPLRSDFHDFPEWKRTTVHDLLLTRNGTPYIHKPVERSIYTNVVQRITLANPLERDFLALAAQSAANNLQGYGVSIESLNYGMWSELLIPEPPLEEALSIVSFIDRETAKIDDLITEQERLIELLQEKRQAVISHAVTKGLNPNAPMKDSGVEWLGEVPEHWAVAAVGYRYSIKLGKMLDTKKITGDHSGKYLRNTDVQWESINVQDLPEMDFDPDELERYSVRNGDLLVCEGGEVGRCAIWRNDIQTCFYQKALHRVRPLSPSTDTCEYQLFVMKMACSKGIFEANSGKATINHLPAEAFRKYRFAYPPKSEQLEIVSFLSERCREIDDLKMQAQKSAGLLQERRSALISAAVTGQIDVRGLVPQEEAA